MRNQRVTAPVDFCVHFLGLVCAIILVLESLLEGTCMGL